jgi:hypothetical protein
MTVVPAMPTERDSTAMAVNSGLARSVRTACWLSSQIDSTIT